MDLFVTAYYAVICGTLGVVSNFVPGLLTRLALGGAVGVAASVLLPWVQGLFGLGGYQ